MQTGDNESDRLNCFKLTSCDGKDNTPQLQLGSSNVNSALLIRDLIAFRMFM